MSGWAIWLLFGSTSIGGFLAFILGKKKNDGFLKLLLSFGGAYLFSISILYLMPEVFSRPDTATGFFMLLGFFFQIILEQFTGGIEHGHIHHHHGKNIRWMQVQVFLSLSLHSFMEGVPLGSGMLERSQESFLLGIVLHEIPAAFALSSIMNNGHFSGSKSIILVLLYASMAPAGALLSHSFRGEMMMHADSFNYLMAFITGTFLHISTIILFENSPNHQFSRYKIVSVGLGASLASLSLLL